MMPKRGRNCGVSFSKSSLSVSALGPKIDLLVPFFISHVNLLTNICQETAAHTEEEERYVKIVKKSERKRARAEMLLFLPAFESH